MHFWLISAPAENGSKEETWKLLNSATNELSQNFKMKIPELRVGTLDNLMSLSDDLERIDRHVESVVHRIEKELHEHAGGEEPTVDGTPVERFTTAFEWDQARYPVKSTLNELVSMIHDITARIDDELKSKLMDYNQLKSNMGQADRKLQGGLNQRTIVDIVRKEHVINSEKLTTVFLAAPKFAVKEFLATYEKWHEFSTDKGAINAVVPKSALKLDEDNEFELYRVVVFKTAEEEFKSKARENRMTVRDFVYTDGQATADSDERTKLKQDTEKAWSGLVRWSKTSYSEAMRAWVHLKAIRVFVESVLRYGLPPTFQAMLVRPGKNEDKVRKALNLTFGHLSAGGISKDEGEAPAGSTKFYPYVDIDMRVLSMVSDD
uniref:V-type proton ATPase subunit C n=1 Tax=Hemiselmis tepida TaxID=464990 RepID=A0A7S0W371_9CRYP